MTCACDPEENKDKLFFRSIVDAAIQMAALTSTIGKRAIPKDYSNMNRLRCVGLALALIPLPILVTAGRVSAQALQGNFFEVPSTDPNFNRLADFVTVTGLVQNTLGPDGLPVVSDFGRTFGGNSGPITDVNALGELQWWTPGTRTVNGSTFTELFDTSAITSVPFSFSNFFPTGQSNDNLFYRTVEWTGQFNIASPGVATFFLGSDDDAWLFVDGKLAVDNGGVKSDQPTQTSTSTLSVGKHSFALFYADRSGVGAGIDFNSSVVLTAQSAAPEPGVLALSMSGVLPAGFAACRRRKSVRAAAD